MSWQADERTDKKMENRRRCTYVNVVLMNSVALRGSNQSQTGEFSNGTTSGNKGLPQPFKESVYKRLPFPLTVGDRITGYLEKFVTVRGKEKHSMNRISRNFVRHILILR